MLRLFVSMLITGLLSGCGLTVANSPKQDVSDMWVYKNVSVAFGVGGWSFFLGACGEVGVPIKAFIHLYAKKGDCIQSISSPLEMAKMKGISVESEKEALSFVRLFTDQSTFMCFHSPMALEYEPQATVVKKETDGFRITRKLVCAEEKDPLGQPLYQVQEKVSFSGVYKIEERHFLRFLSKKDAGFLDIE